MKAAQVPSNLPPLPRLSQETWKGSTRQRGTVVQLPRLKAKSCQAGRVLSGALPSGSAYVLTLESQCH